MHPHPLFRMGPYLTLDDGSGCCGQFFDPVLERTADWNRQGRVDFGFVGSIGTSMDEAGDDRAASTYCQHCATRRRPSGSAEKRDKDPRNAANVLINEKGGDPVSGQCSNHLFAGCRPAKYDLGSESTSHCRDQPVESRIVEPASGGRQGYARNRQTGAEKFPGSAVAGGEDDATTALESFEEILGSLEHA